MVLGVGWAVQVMGVNIGGGGGGVGGGVGVTGDGVNGGG